MKPVPINEIETTWDEICDLDEDACMKLTEQFSREHPFLIVYAVAQDENCGNEDATLLSLATLVWKLLKRTPPLQIDDRAIEKAEEKNIRFMEKMDAGSELGQTDAVGGLMTNYNQRELLGFCLEVLMSGYEDTPELAPEEIGLQFLTLKTMIDCLDR